ncbi:nucleotide pyrophosphohydrolase [Nakamurella flavida]|uniref:Nucleotide pyrophosphohydrolase n=1 Tax=Nakamurella flavida TaxID=363630 RepID=A0A938YRY5_9ACTN|nr:nucleotide pyrophosphohydrolase [Nakamurella flavida]MBM9478118.1 nucleotide pyrophosphohydrolase [Nakamurella flavida]MDP9778661.1 dCTP diphosphatase [Nakamurella flavida]
MYDLRELTEAVRTFNRDRDWEQFHDAKSLLLALVGEVGEVAELLQWQPAATVREDVKAGRLHTRLAEELADVLLYLVMLADETGVDLGPAAAVKLAATAQRYPASKFRGQAPERQ